MNGQLRHSVRSLLRQYKKLGQANSERVPIWPMLNIVRKARAAPIDRLKISSLTSAVACSLPSFTVRCGKQHDLFRNNPWLIALKCVQGRDGLSVVRNLEELAVMIGACNIFVANALVSWYAASSLPRDAHRALLLMQPNDRRSISWCAVISLLAEDGSTDAAVALAKDMRKSSAPINAMTAIAIFKAAAVSANCELTQIGMEIFQSVCASDVRVTTSAIGALAACADVSTAQRVFDGIPLDQQDLKVFTVMMSATGSESSALLLLDKVHSRKLARDVPFVLSIAKAAGKLKSLALADRCRSLTIQLHCTNNALVASALIAMYARFGNMFQARKVFDAVPAAERTADLYASLMSAYGHEGVRDGFAADRIFSEMEQQRVKPHLPCLLTALATAAATGFGKLGQRAVAACRKYALFDDIRLQTAAIAMYGRCGMLSDARHVFDGIPATQRNVVVYASLLSGLSAHGKGDEAVANLLFVR